MGTYIGNNSNNTKTATQEGGQWKSWTMWGRGGDDNLTGGPKNDALYGENGNDKLYGLGGDDYLDGGSGNDTLVGGLNNDTYIVNSLSDVVTENIGEGIDTIYSSVNIYGNANVENFYLTGDAGYAQGNELNNTLSGNYRNNHLLGGEGHDTLYGGSGNDLMYGQNGNDTLLGEAGNDFISGGEGFDDLTGGSGSDTLWGLGGDDYFFFNSPFEGIDTIKDFEWEQLDKILVSGTGFGIGSNEFGRFTFEETATGGALFFDGSQFASLQSGSEFDVYQDIIIF